RVFAARRTQLAQAVRPGNRHVRPVLALLAARSPRAAGAGNPVPRGRRQSAEPRLDVPNPVLQRDFASAGAQSRVAGAGLEASASVTTRPPLAVRVAVVAGLMAVGAALLFVTSLPAVCPMRLILHVPCPSCGLTRAARLVASGDFAGA